MFNANLRSVWFWVRAALEVVALSWTGGVLAFYGGGLIGAVESPHGAEALVAVLVGMGLGLTAALALVARRGIRPRSVDDHDR